MESDRVAILPVRKGAWLVTALEEAWKVFMRTSVGTRG